MSSSEDDENMDVSTSKPSETSQIGKILSVTVENFMTFGAATMHPGKYLNILIGPNGTGKSSMVAAIVIGMGGSTKVLSARLRLADFIRNGEQYAKIEVRLFKNATGKEYIGFERLFDINGKSQYKIDDKKVTEKMYLEKIRSINIQVENLCQFLPQDRVQDFAKQNPQELLNSTQLSVCTPEIVDIFEKLKQLRKDQLSSRGTASSYEVSLKEHEERLEILKVQVTNVKKKNQLTEQKDVCLKKKAWIEFEEHYQKCQTLNEDLKTAKTSFDKHEVERTKIQKQAAQILNLKKKYDETMQSHAASQKKSYDQNNRLKEQLEKIEDEIIKSQGDLKHTNKLSLDQDNELKESAIILQAYINDFKQLEAVNREGGFEEKAKAIDTKISDIKETIKRLIESRTSLVNHLESVIKPRFITMENRIKTMENVNEMKLEVLKPKLGDTYNAVLWLRQNKHLFRCKVYEPILLELNIEHQNYAKFIENCIPMRDLTAFTCEDVDDMSLLINNLRTKQRLSCNVIHSQPADSLNYRSRIPIGELKKFGGERYMIDCVSGPFPILNYLCQAYQIQNVLIGNQSLDLNSEQIPQSISLIFTPTKRISVTTSKYTRQRSSISNPIYPRDLFGAKVDEKQLNSLRLEKEKVLASIDELKNKRIKIEGEINKREEECKNKNREKHELLKNVDKQKDCKSRWERLVAKMNETKKYKLKLQNDMQLIKANTKKLVVKMIKLKEDHTNVVVQLISNKCSFEKARSNTFIFSKSNNDISMQIAECEENYTRSKRYVTTITNLLDSAKRLCKEKKIAALKLTNNAQPSDGSRFPLKAQFDALPSSIEELVEKIGDIEGMIECMSSGDNDNSLQEYENRLKQVQELKNQIRDFAENFDKIEQKMDQLHNTWHPKIMETLATINKNFENFMISMNCAGEVDLIKADERDYEKYGIEIRVKYRANERLQALDRFVQSGGERAVAIAVYSLSLQQLTQVPFRCVDEINQGMDPDNERKIFDMLVNHVSRAGQSQFFYVTPKLLPSMVWNKFLTCMVVHNGQNADNNNYFSP